MLRVLPAYQKTHLLCNEWRKTRRMLSNQKLMFTQPCIKTGLNEVGKTRIIACKCFWEYRVRSTPGEFENNLALKQCIIEDSNGAWGDIS